MTEYLDFWTRDRRAGRLSLAQRLQFALAPKPATLISGLDQTKLAIGIDTSHWNGKLSPALVAGADVVLPKLSDGYQVRTGAWDDLGNYKDDQVDATIQTCYDVHRPCIPYHFVQWNYTSDQWMIDKIIDWQYKIIENALAGKIPHKSYHGLSLDCETLGCTDTNYRNIVAGLYDRLMTSPLLDGMPLLIYTSNYIMSQYPAFQYWIAAPGTNRLLWLAQWIYTAKWTGTWDQFKALILPNINMRVVTPTSWAAVQYSATCAPEGYTVDLNAFSRTRENLYDVLGFETTTPPPPPPVEPPPADTVTRAEFDAAVAAIQHIRDTLHEA